MKPASGARRSTRGQAVAIIAALLVQVGCVSPASNLFYDHFERSYDPVDLEEELIPPPPNHHRIAGVPWISHDEVYCQSTILQMVAAYHGIEEPIEYFNWLMGHTYSAFHKGSFYTFVPMYDPEMGLMTASPYLGLERTLYATNDRDLAMRAARSFLSRGYPVRVPLDYSILTGDRFFFPHAELLVGYEGDEFLYHEPGFSDRNTYGEEPLRIAADTLMDAVLSHTGEYGYSRRYYFCVFQPAEPRRDPEWIRHRNGDMLIGGRVFMRIVQGEMAYHNLAAEIDAGRVPEWAWREVLYLWMDAGRYPREDNARFIRSRFSHDRDLLDVADLLGESAARYARICAIIDHRSPPSTDEQREISSTLVAIGEIERRAGELLQGDEQRLSAR